MIHWLTPTFGVCGQLKPEDLAQVAALGVRSLINNRPDHEEPDQPTAAELASAAAALGLAYVEIPVRGAPGAPERQATAQALTALPAPVLAFCRSGARSARVWQEVMEAGTGIEPVQ